MKKENFTEFSITFFFPSNVYPSDKVAGSLGSKWHMQLVLLSPRFLASQYKSCTMRFFFFTRVFTSTYKCFILKNYRKIFSAFQIFPLFLRKAVGHPHYWPNEIFTASKVSLAFLLHHGYLTFKVSSGIAS